MNIPEMSSEFDILYNQVNSNQAASIDEYEKSVFLTKAQKEILVSYFDPRQNKILRGFDDGSKRQYDFSSLIENKVLEEYHIDDSSASVRRSYDPRSKVYMLPKDLFLILNESIVETRTSDPSFMMIYQITPISYDMYSTLMRKPYQYPPKRSVWRIITEQTSDVWQTSTYVTSSNPEKTTLAETIGRYVDEDNDTIEYRMRYLRKPEPIILVDLGNDLSIDGKHGNEVGLAVDANGQVILTPQAAYGIPCMLPSGIHHEIVQRAVELASAVYNPQAAANIAGIGSISSTNIGVMPSNNDKR